MDPQNPPALDENLANQDVNLTEDEKANLGDAAKKFDTVAAQKAHWRTKAKTEADKREAIEKENAELKIKLSQNPPAPTPPANSPSTPSAPQVDAEKMARKVAMDLRRDESIMALPEDKRESVREVYTALTANKEVDVTNINSYLETAMRAVGVNPPVSSANRIISNSNGNIPPTTPPGPTAEQIEFAKRVGNDPAKVYGGQVDTSALAGAEKFFPKTS